jgi:hypothetical protein
MIFRRTVNPPIYERYQDYKPLLRKDFLYNCAYCLSHEHFVGDIWTFTVDHFRPKRTFKHLINAYSNLYFACARCNTYKGSLWPKEHELAMGYGFVDPCATDPFVHFHFASSGEVRGLTSAGSYSIQHLRLDRQQLRQRRQRLANAVAAELATFQRCLQIRARVSTLITVMGTSEDLQSISDANEETLRQALGRLRALVYPPLLTID